MCNKGHPARDGCVQRPELNQIDDFDQSQQNSVIVMELNNVNSNDIVELEDKRVNFFLVTV